jgi:hypothetical protein
MNFKYPFLLVLLVTSLSSCKTQNITTDSVKSKLPEFSWDRMPLYMHVRKANAFSNKEIKYLSKFPLITFEKTTGNKDSGSTEKGTIKAAKAVKKINPNAKILYYKNVVINWSTYEEDEVFLEKHPEAYLVDDKGKKALMANKKTGFFDISQEQVRTYWLDHVTKMANNPVIDGLFLDANIKVLAPVFFKSRVGLIKQKEIETGYLSMMKEVDERLGKDNILLANILRVRPEFKDAGREYLKFFTGSYLEGFEHENFGMTYEDYLAKGIETVQKTAREGKVIALSIGLGKALKNAKAGIDDVRKRIDKNSNINKRLDYVLAIFLVCAEKNSYVYPHDGYGVKNSITWLKTFPQYEKKLGAPKGPALKDGYVYTRSFEHLDVWLDIKNKKAVLNWK